MLTHRGTVELKTPRLTLRRYRIEDAEDTYRWCRDPEVSRYVTWEPHTSPEATAELLAGWIGKYEAPDYYHWTIEYEGASVGNIALMPKDRLESAEIGYALARSLWRQGIMTEAASVVVRFAFREVGMRRLVIRWIAENTGSGGVAQKCGFREEGIERQAFLGKDGKPHDIVRTSLLFDEWERLEAGADTVLETERLILRPARTSDFEAVHAYAADPESTRYMGWEPNTPEDTRRFLRTAENAWSAEDPKDFEFVLIRKSDGALVGGCGLYTTGELGEAGWILRPEFRRRGYATEAGEALLRFGFAERKLWRIRARCDSRNTPSWHVMERLGMRREGFFRQARRKGNEHADGLEYAILSEEWEAER